MENMERYMRRALQLARNGMGFASPNPMVGAVIVAPDGRVIGEGWHRRCGQGHAEVNAVASVAVADEPLLTQSTMYVTLEPCSHYGKTPPCAELILRKGIPHVVVAMLDPFEKVAGRGVAMLRDAGVKVDVGMLEAESRSLNRRFITAHTQHRPFITLKWAESADGFMDWTRNESHRGACRFSTTFSTLSTMRMRSMHDAILTTSSTVIADDSRLTVRDWDGNAPKRVILDAHGRLTGNETVFSGEAPIVFGPNDEHELSNILHSLYSNHGITSLMVEAGPRLLSILLAEGLWDVARREVATSVWLACNGCCHAPSISSDFLGEVKLCDENQLYYYRHGG